MKVVLRTLALSALCVSSAFASARYSKKTFLMPRAVGVNKAMETSLWHPKFKRCEHNHLKTVMQLTPFYQASTNGKRIGEYFGIGNCSNCFTVGDPSVEGVDIDGSLLIHNVELTGPECDERTVREFIQGKVCLKPEQNVWGVRFDFLQDLNFPLKGVYFKASTVLSNVENNLKLRISDGNSVTIGSQEFTLADYFNGEVQVGFGDEESSCVTETPETFPFNDNNLQCPLKHAKMNCRKHSDFGLADIDLALGYRLLHKKHKYVFVTTGITIPTGNEAHGRFVFEPIFGNGDHVGIFATVDAGTKLWKGEQGMLRVDGGMNVKYLFEGTEERTLSIKGYPFAQYYLVGKKGQQDQPLFPLANVLTRHLRVKPGWLLDATLDFTFKSKHFLMDVGYNLYWKDEESACLKSKCDDDVYGVADPTFETSGPLLDSGGLADNFLNDNFIQASDFDLDAARTPAQLTHKIFGAFGYKIKFDHSWKMLVSVGGSYEFAQENSALEQYAVWVKAAVIF